MEGVNSCIHIPFVPTRHILWLLVIVNKKFDIIEGNELLWHVWIDLNLLVKTSARLFERTYDMSISCFQVIFIHVLQDTF